ncbi:MAG: hypothetical protein IJZ79_02560 [Bacilli bacterium]|nr:hypothetical protein [Bacilli bacterium]MBQ8218608.1 hypothetical protein [Bacilli bacterium]
MINWNIIKLDKNHYKIIDVHTNNYIEITLSTDLSNNPELLFNDTRDISDDNVIFCPNAYPTPNNDQPIIGEAYLYENRKCIEKSLVIANIVNTDIPDKAKTYIELLYT